MLAAAQLVGPNTYRLALPPGREPVLTSTRGERLWVLDSENGVDTIDLDSGDMFAIAKLPAAAHISQWAAGRAYTYALDASAGKLYVVNVARELVDTYPITLLRPVTSAAVGIDDRFWAGLGGAPYLVSFDPVSHRTNLFDLGVAHVSALTIDSSGRILYADDDRSTVGAFDPRTGLLVEVKFARTGSTTSLVVDASSTLWLSTSTGELYSVRGGVATLVAGLQRPIARLVLDDAGNAWYLAPLPSGATGFGLGRTDGTATASVSAPVVGVAFNALGRAWLADPRGAFYIVLQGGR